MTLFIDRKFVSLVSMKLERFSQKQDYLWNFRCPFCFDSKKNKLKCRGYFYRKKANISYICHNCNVSCSLGNFLRRLDPPLFKQYQMELYTSTNGGNTKKPEFPDTVRTLPKFSSSLASGLSIPCVKNLSENHTAVQYLLKRAIPRERWDSIYYADDFLAFCDEQFPEHGKNLIKEDSRIVFPFYDTDGKFLGLQGRSLPPFKHKVKYITMKASDDCKKVFGLDRIDFTETINVVEGPIDSMFLKNCIAMMDSALYTAPEVVGKNYSYRFVFDNEPRNPQIVKGIGKALRLGYKVCLFPESFPKDINDMILAGHDVNRLLETYETSGLEGELKFKTWRKV